MKAMLCTPYHMADLTVFSVFSKQAYMARYTRSSILDTYDLCRSPTEVHRNLHHVQTHTNKASRLRSESMLRHLPVQLGQDVGDGFIRNHKQAKESLQNRGLQDGLQ